MDEWPRVTSASNRAFLAATRSGGYRIDLLDRLLGHDHWATAQLLDVSRNLTDAQLDQQFDIGHRTLRDTFDHLIFNIAAWTGLMIERPIDSDRLAQRYDRSVGVLIDRYEQAHSSFSTTARRMRDEQRLDDTFVDHFDFRQTFGGTIIHVAMHNTEHRSEVLHILGRLGMPDLPEVDPQAWEHQTQGI